MRKKKQKKKIVFFLLLEKKYEKNVKERKKGMCKILKIEKEKNKKKSKIMHMNKIVFFSFCFGIF